MKTKRLKIVELCSRADQARREHRREDARRDLYEAIAQARTAGNAKLLAQSLSALGQIEREDGNLVVAMAFYEEVIALHLSHDNPLGVALAIRHLGDIHRENDCPDVAGMCYQEAMAIYAAHPEARALDFANALRSFAVHRQEAGDTRAARRLWRATLDLYAALGVESGVRECDHRLSDLQAA